MTHLFCNNGLEWRLEKLLILLMVLILVPQIFFGVRLTKVCGDSMAPAFADGEYVFSMPVHNVATLQRGDVITFYPDSESSTMYVKRIVALPGETIEAQSSAVLVDGKEISFWLGTGTWGPFVVPESSVFVLGDNRAIACDSRTLGPVSFEQINSKIVGKTVLLS